MRKILIWFLIAVTLALAGCQLYLYKTVDTSKKKDNESTYAFKLSRPLNITILGDSVAKGTGDEKGSGFSTYIPEYLKSKTNGNISVCDAGVNGLKSGELVEELKSTDMGKKIADSDIIVISIGGNDILSLYTVDDSKKLSAFEKVQADYLSNLKNILAVIREKNQGAEIVLTGLYNPSEDISSPLIDMLLNSWNKASESLIKKDSRGIFVDVNDIFKSNSKSYISSDRLHPNSTGYKAISFNICQQIDKVF